MNFLIGGDTYLWLYINFQNQINVGIRVLNSLNWHKKFFYSNLIEFFFLIQWNIKLKEIKSYGNLFNLKTLRLIKNF